MGRWKLLTGKHHMRGAGGNKIYRPGDIFVGKKEDIGGFIDRWEQLDPDDPEPMPSTGPKLKALGGGWFFVINPATGFPINDKKMRRAEAVALIADAMQAEEMRKTGAELEVEVIEQVETVDAESLKKLAGEMEPSVVPTATAQTFPDLAPFQPIGPGTRNPPVEKDKTTDGDDTGGTTGAEGPATGGEPAAQETIPLDDPEALA